MRHPLADLHGWIVPPALIAAALTALAGLVGLHLDPPDPHVTQGEHP